MSIGIVACGALATHIADIAASESLDITIYPLPPLLHNRPEKIAGEVDALLNEIKDKHSKCAVAYADCGTYGALDTVIANHGVQRLGGNHCYDIFAGREKIESIMESDAGTYFLTDFLVKSFHRSVIVELGLDKRPELRDDYFKNYSRVIWLAQQPSAELEALANAAAAEIGLPLEIQVVGYGQLSAQVRELLRN
jgi:RNAse (barnase) inhibitor barstar